MAHVGRPARRGRASPAVRSLSRAIQRARTLGVGNLEIAAMLERSIEIRPLTIEKDERQRFVGVCADRAVSLDELLTALEGDE